MQNDETVSPALTYPSLLIHADDHLAPTTDIAPTLHPSTTYRYPVNPDDWRPIVDGEEEHPDEPVYTRVSYSTTERVEKVLGELMGGAFLERDDSQIRSCIDVWFGTVGNSRIIRSY